MLIFDLDHTVICSKHRQSTLADGSLDLAHWIENNTPEKIAKDSLLPISKIMIEAKKVGNVVGICTARVLQQADYDFLSANGLQYDFVLSRKMGDNTGDADLKENLLREYATTHNIDFNDFCRMIDLFYDDNKAVLARLESLNIKAFDAILTNKLLQDTL